MKSTTAYSWRMQGLFGVARWLRTLDAMQRLNHHEALIVVPNVSARPLIGFSGLRSSAFGTWAS